MAKKYDIEYKDFKDAINASASKLESDTRDLAFSIDLEKVDTLIANSTGCISLKVNSKSNPVLTSSIPFLSEYFIKDKLAWFNEAKEFTTLIFVENRINDARLQELLELIKSESTTDTPEHDIVALVAEIVAKYSCYFAVVVSYISNDPLNSDKLSYSIICRANKVTISKENYEYKPQDMA